jgi:uncharacterized damage-inducible protein DinB
MSDAADMTNDEALDVLAEGDDAIRRLTAQLSAVEITEPRTMGGGEWSVKDLLGHITQWEQFGLDVADAAERGATAAFQESSKSVDELNADAIASKAGRPLERIRAEFDEVHARLVAVIQGMSDEQWRSRTASPRGAGHTLAENLGGVLGAPDRPFGHALAHLPDLEAYVRARRGS